MTYQAVLFDLDGTLLDTLEDLADSMNAVLLRRGFPAHTLESYRFLVGAGLENLVRRALPPGQDQTAVAACVADMRAEYGRRWDRKTRPYSGITAMLQALRRRGLQLAVLSNKPDDFTRLTVARLLPEICFCVVLGARPGVPHKPDPGAALEIAAKLGLAPAQFLYVGDTDIDMYTAQAAGMYAVGALWGFRPRSELVASGAQTLIEQPEQLLKIL